MRLERLQPARRRRRRGTSLITPSRLPEPPASSKSVKYGALSRSSPKKARLSANVVGLILAEHAARLRRPSARTPWRHGDAAASGSFSISSPPRTRRARTPACRPRARRESRRARTARRRSGWSPSPSTTSSAPLAACHRLGEVRLPDRHRVDLAALEHLAGLRRLRREHEVRLDLLDLGRRQVRPLEQVEQEVVRRRVARGRDLARPSAPRST